MNSAKSYWPGLGILLVGLLWGIGCGGKKVDPLELGRRFNQAEQALEEARNQGTQELAESAFFEAEQLLAQAKQAHENGDPRESLKLIFQAESAADLALAQAQYLRAQSRVEKSRNLLTDARLQENSLKLKTAQTHQALAEERAYQAEEKAATAKRRADLAEQQAEQSDQQATSEIRRTAIQLQIDRAQVYLEIAKSVGAEIHALQDYQQAESTVQEAIQLLKDYQFEQATEIATHAEALAKDVQLVTTVAATEAQANSSQALATAELVIQQVETEIAKAEALDAENHAEETINQARRLRDQAKLQVQQEDYQSALRSAKQARTSAENAYVIAEKAEQEKRDVEAMELQIAQAKDLIFKLGEQLDSDGSRRVPSSVSQLVSISYQKSEKLYQAATESMTSGNYAQAVSQGQQSLDLLQNVIAKAKEIERVEIDLVARLKRKMPKTATIQRTEKGVLVRLDTDLFEPNSPTLTPKHYSSLKQLGQIIKQNSRYKIRIEAHSDSRGSLDVNLKMSQKRADNFTQYLTQKCGAPKELITAIGMGEKHPVANNINKVGRAKNRRVDTIFLTRESAD